MSGGAAADVAAASVAAAAAGAACPSGTASAPSVAASAAASASGRLSAVASRPMSCAAVPRSDGNSPTGQQSASYGAAEYLSHPPCRRDPHAHWKPPAAGQQAKNSAKSKWLELKWLEPKCLRIYNIQNINIYIDIYIYTNNSRP